MVNLFMKHLNDINETYLRHMGFALCYSYKFFILFIMCLIHAIFPDAFNGIISKKVEYINKHMENRL